MVSAQLHSHLAQRNGPKPLSGEDDLRVSFFTKSQRNLKPTEIEMEMGNAYMYYLLYSLKWMANGLIGWPGLLAQARVETV